MIMIAFVVKNAFVIINKYVVYKLTIIIKLEFNKTLIVIINIFINNLYIIYISFIY